METTQWWKGSKHAIMRRRLRKPRPHNASFNSPPLPSKCQNRSLAVLSRKPARTKQARPKLKPNLKDLKPNLKDLKPALKDLNPLSLLPCFPYFSAPPSSSSNSPPPSTIFSLSSIPAGLHRVENDDTMLICSVALWFC